MAIEIEGNWKKGFSLEMHSVSSKYIGDNEYGKPQFDTDRSEVGELVYQLKSKNNLAVIPKIVLKIKECIKGIEKFDFIIAVPPSKIERKLQPVFLICDALASEYKIEFLKKAILKESTTEEIKSIQDKDRRIEILKKVMTFNNKYDLQNKNILLVDDIYRSGATLSVVADVLINQAGVNNVYVLTLTKTRVNR